MSLRDILSGSGFYFSVIFCLLFLLFFPVDYYFIPNLGAFFEPVLLPVIDWFGHSVLGIEDDFTAQLLSDSTGLFIFILLISILAAIVAPFLAINLEVTKKIKLWFYTLLAYYIALTLIKYGADKIFKCQFYFPEPNTLYTPVGKLTPDILYWSFMGSSYSYTVFSGIIEIIPALLLLFKRTRLLGALIAFMVLLNVVMINFGFDITVKLYSLILLAFAGLIIIPELPKLYNFFIRKKTEEIQESTPIFKSKKEILTYTIVKVLVVGLILVESFGIYFKTGNLNDDNYPRPYLHGAYDVLSYSENDTIIAADLNNTKRFRRVFFHRRHYFIVQTMDDHFVDFKYQLEQGVNKLIIKSSTDEIFEFDYDLHLNQLTLVGEFYGKNIMVICKKINLNELPLKAEKFHWSIDDF